MAGQLENKVVVVTGGADGIGLECALAYTREGASVAVLDRDAEALERAKTKLDDSSVFLVTDVSDPAAVERAIAEVIKRYGRINALHNNAGIASPSKPLHETSEFEWDQLFRINVKSVYWTTKFAFEALVKNEGSILNTASMVGLIGQQQHAAYVASKGAMIALTKAMAIDYAPHKVRVNAVCPAGVWTPMLERWCQEQPDAAAMTEALNNMHLLGYCPHGDVIADAAVFLLSAKARFITGCILPVSGGAELGYRR